MHILRGPSIESLPKYYAKIKGNPVSISAGKKLEVDDQERIRSILVREEALANKSNSSSAMEFNLVLQAQYAMID